MSLVVGLHHVQLAMPRGREAEARAFYVGMLGLEEVEKPTPSWPEEGAGSAPTTSTSTSA